MLRHMHTAAAVLCVALFPLAPLGMWVYARVASVDRGETLSQVDRVLAVAPPYPGGRELSRNVYEERAWTYGESLVPISDYRVEITYKLRHEVTPVQLVRYYRSRLPSWQIDIEKADCSTIGLPSGCGALSATFHEGGHALVVRAVETMRAPRLLREYAVHVSQKPWAAASG